MATPADIAQELALELGEQYSDPDISDQFLRWVKETYQEIAAMSPRVFYKNTSNRENVSAGSGTVTLSAGVVDVRDVVLVEYDGDAVYTKLAYYPKERIDARGEASDEDGTPKWWYFGGINSAGLVYIYLHPESAAACTVLVNGVSAPGTLADTDVIPLPGDFLVPLRHGVRARAYQNENLLEQAQLSQSTYMQQLAALTARFTGPQSSASRLAVKRMRGNHQAAGAVDGS